MDEGLGFGVLLTRLAERRQLDLDAVARAADVADFGNVLRDGRPSPGLLRRLAPALSLHTSDLFVIAGVDVPDDLAPGDHTTGSWIPVLVRSAVALGPEQRNVLRDFVASLPHET